MGGAWINRCDCLFWLSWILFCCDNHGGGGDSHAAAPAGGGGQFMNECECALRELTYIPCRLGKHRGKNLRYLLKIQKQKGMSSSYLP